MSSVLSEYEQAQLLQLYAQGNVTQEELSSLFGVTRWYVRKLIMQRKVKEIPGVQAPVLTPADQALLEVARATGLNALQLQYALSIKPLTDHNIFQWLVQQPQERLARIMFQAVLAQQRAQQDSFHAQTENSRATGST